MWRLIRALTGRSKHRKVRQIDINAQAADDSVVLLSLAFTIVSIVGGALVMIYLRWQHKRRVEEILRPKISAGTTATVTGATSAAMKKKTKFSNRLKKEAIHSKRTPAVCAAMTDDSAASGLRVAALYHFTAISDPNTLQQLLLQFCQQNGIRGTLLLAFEGINGTICGTEIGIVALIKYIEELPELRGQKLEVKYSQMPLGNVGFRHMRVKVKSEIVTMGRPDIKPIDAAGAEPAACGSLKGEYVEPEHWNDLICREDVLVVDTRNTYETHIGKFHGAIDPKTETFRDFPTWADQNLHEIAPSNGDTSHNGSTEHGNSSGKVKSVAMYCTGGIRCEKATAYLKQKLGVENVYHLKGGILKYLERIPAENSLWEGECFVFDERVSVKHQLEPGSYAFCRGCKMPLSEAERDPTISPEFEEGVSCTYCFHSLTEKQLKQNRERQKQYELSRKRGEEHIGQDHL